MASIRSARVLQSVCCRLGALDSSATSHGGLQAVHEALSIVAESRAPASRLLCIHKRSAQDVAVCHRTFAASAAPAELQSREKEGITLGKSAVEKLRDFAAEKTQVPVLRVEVEGGGCSGYQYTFSLEGSPREGDRVFETEGMKVVCDDVSYEFLRGATVDYEDDLIRSAFSVVSNPNAESSCGCGSSFVAK